MTRKLRNDWPMVAILDFWISPKLQEIAEIKQKIIKGNQRTRRWPVNIKVTVKW